METTHDDTHRNNMYWKWGDIVSHGQYASYSYCAMFPEKDSFAHGETTELL
jgi:hypothetical protein